MSSWVLIFALAVSATALSPAQANRPTAPDVGEAGTAGRSTGSRPGWGWGGKPEYRMIDGDRVYRVGGAVLAPRLLKRANPQIPESARRPHTSGSVIVWAVIGRDGLVHHPRVVRSLEPSLDAIAMQTLTQWRFTPARRRGELVNVELNLDVPFFRD